MKIGACTAVVILLLALPAAALALATETFGNAPAVKQPEWAEGVIDVVNLKSRVYSHWVNGNEHFFYRGDARALNEALRKYAAVKQKVRQLILLPGSGKQQSFHGKAIEFDWKFHVPSGIYREASKRTDVVLTAYVSAPKPRPLDRKRVEKWLADLQSEAFKTRERANRELQKLGHDVKPFLREALKAQPALEARRRIEGLLERLRGLDVTDLEIPRGITVITVDDLLAKGLKELKDTDRNVRSLAIQDLTRLAAYSDRVVPALIERFQKDKDDLVRRVAAACLSHFEGQAKTVVPVLKQGLNDPDAYIRSACQTGLERIAKARAQPGDEERHKRELAILREINEFKKAAGGSN
jgi:hypothetical protein